MMNNRQANHFHLCQDYDCLNLIDCERKGMNLRRMKIGSLNGSAHAGRTD